MDPVEHAVHVAEPAAGANVPPAHDVHAPPLTDEEPAAHGVHAVAPAELDCPAGQLTHAPVDATKYVFAEHDGMAETTDACMLPTVP
jgi:hypothetical protein